MTKIIPSLTIALSMILTGWAMTPLAVQADDGIHANIQSDSHVNLLGTHINVNSKIKTDNDNDNDSDSINQKDALWPTIDTTAVTNLNASVKAANTAYKAAKTTAKTTLRASIQASTTATDRIAALKAYVSSLLAAFQVKASAVEAAFQAFLNTNFNEPPVANAQTLNATENTQLSITLTGSDPQNNPLTYTVVSNPSHGTLSGIAPHLVYTPDANFTGTDSFTFRDNDGISNSTLTTVTINVAP